MLQLTEALVDFLHSGRSLLAASRDASLRPWMSRAVGVRVGADRGSITVFLPDAASVALRRVATPGQPFALTANRPSTFTTMQLKGTITATRPAVPEERTLVESQSGGFAAELAVVGYPLQVAKRLATWPATAIDVRLEAVFEQSPGPGAGHPMVLP